MAGLFDDVLAPSESSGGGLFDDILSAKEPEGGDFTRGLKTSFKQLPQLAYGLAAGGAAALEKVTGEGGLTTGAKKAAIQGFKEWGDKIEADSKPSDSWGYSYDQAKQGNFGALVDWLQHGLGYVGGQAIQTLATGGIGAVGGKFVASTAAKQIAEGMVAKEAARLTAESAGKMTGEQLAKQATANVAGKFATIGQNSAIGASAVGMEGGEIFGDLTAQNADRQLTGAELGKAFAATLAAGGLEFVGDKLGLDIMLGKSALLKPAERATGLLGRAARGAIAGGAAAPIEAGTEYGQTLIEEYGKGKDPLSPESLKQAGDAAALGALGGAAVGGVGGAIRGPKVDSLQPPKAEEPPAPTGLLGYNPDPFVLFPDGTVGRREDVERYIAGLPEDQRVAARAKLAGLAPQKADPVESILSAPDADTAIRNFVDGVQTSIAGTGADALLAPANDFLGAVRGREAEVAADAADLADFRASEERNLQVARAQAQQRQAELDALQATGTGQYGIPIEAKPAVEQAATLEAPTAMQLAMQKAREKAATPPPRPSEMLASDVAPAAPAAPAPSVPPNTSASAAPARSPDILPTDIARKDGTPFQTASGARYNQRFAGGVDASDVVPVQGGFVVRPKPQPSASDATTQPQATPTSATPDAGAAAVPAATEVQPAAGGADLAAIDAQPGDGALSQGTTATGQYDDGGKWKATYRTVRRVNGSVVLVREFVDDDGARTEHLTMDGTWARGEPATTVVSGATQLEGPESFQSEQAALQHASEVEGATLQGAKAPVNPKLIPVSKRAPPAQALAGEKIDKEWTAFAPESGTKGVPRAEMPQIKAEARGALTQFLGARGITHESVEMPAADLKPTQAEFSPAKVAKAKAYEGGERSILVSSDGHILDGHHQWAAALEDGKPVKAIRLDAPIEKLLAEVKEFPSVQAAAGATKPKDQRLVPVSKRQPAQTEDDLMAQELERLYQEDIKADIRQRLGLEPKAKEAKPKASAFSSFLREFGIKPVHAADITGESILKANNRLPRTFRKNGLALDELVIRAVERGFLTGRDVESTKDNGGANKLVEMIQAEIRGERQVSTEMASDDAQERTERVQRMEIEGLADAIGLPYDPDISTDRLANMVSRVQRALDASKEPKGSLKADRILRNAVAAAQRVEANREQLEAEFESFASAPIKEQNALLDVFLDDDGNPTIVRQVDAMAEASWNVSLEEWEAQYEQADAAEAAADNPARQAGAPDDAGAGQRAGDDQENGAEAQRGSDEGQSEGLTAPTRADVLRQQADAEAEAKRREEGGDKPLPGKKVTGDTPDMFNTQGSVFDAPAEPEPAAAIPEDAQEHAKSLGGRVIWHEGDVALVEGYSLLSGDSVYIATKGTSRTRVDIQGYTGPGFTEAERAKLLQARADAVARSEGVMERNPDGPFKDSTLVFADDVSPEVAGVVREWVGMLGLGSARIVVTTPESGAKMADTLAGRFRRIGKASLSGENTNGTMQPLGDGDFHIAIRPNVSRLKTLEVLAHELGHIVEKRTFASADKATQDAIREAHAQWVRDNGSGSALDMAKSMRAMRSGRTTGFSPETKASDASAYWRSFSEWFADQVSRWATTQDKPVTAVERFFARLGEKLRQFFSSQGEKFKPQSTVAQWLDSLGEGMPVVDALDVQEAGTRTPEDDAGNVAMFSRADDARPSITPKALRRFVDDVTDGGIPGVNIADTVADLPAVGQKRIQSEGMQGVRGMFDKATGKVWLVRENIGGEAEAQFVLLHEAFHRGLLPVLGDAVKPVLNRIYLTNKSVREQADRLAKELKIGRMEAIEEVLADMAGEGKARDLSGWDRLVALIRQFVEKLGFDLTFTDDMVDDLVAAVRREGLKGGVHLNTPTSQTDTPAFRKWFGDSKVVDANGQPLVVYHGTAGDFSEFSKDVESKHIPLPGFFFTPEPAYADRFAESAGREFRDEDGYIAGSEGANVMPVFLSMQNPFVEDLTKSGQGGFYPASAIKEMIEYAQSKGHDGVILKGWQDGSGPVQYIVFRPEQIKSAIGNRGTFDPQNPDIRYSRPLLTGRTLPQAWQAPDPSRLDNLIYSLQDKQIDTKRVVKAVRDAIGGLADNLDPYLQEELYHGRAAKATKDFLDGSLRPLMVDLQARGVEISDFEEYLHNRHAERRNVQVAKVNPAMPDGGSGIKTADARAYLAGLPAGKRRAYEALAKRVDQINRDTRALLVSSGLEKQETIDAWDAAYGDEYVPLMREEMDGGAMGIGQGFSVRGGSSKRAMGSDKPVADILANIALQREKAITRAEKRRIGEALYGMVLSAPNDDFWFAVDPALQQNPSQITATAMQLISMGLNPADAQSIAAEPTQRYIDPRTNQVAERINPALRSADNVLAVRIDGEDKYVFFNTKDERAMRMVKALKNLDADQLGEVMGTVSKMTRYFSSINTQYNPIFGVVNVTRDIQTALLNLQSTPLKGMQREVAKHIGPALRGIYIDLRDRRAGKPTTSAYAQLWEEFQNEGGATGYRDMYANAKERAEAIADELKAIKDGTLKKTGKGILNWLSDYNESMENAVRVAAYKVGKEQGLSNQQAASIAKNLTVNFNRKGQVALQAGALYAFFNASVQGTARIAQTMFEGGKLSGLGKRILTGGLMLGSMQAMLLAAAGFDDDEPPDFVRERSLVLPIGGDKYVSIPMPLGFHVIPNLARIPTEWALGGFKDTPKRLGQLVGLFADAFNPIGSAGLSLQTLTPTIIDPLAALAENRDFTGKPIAKQDFNSMQPTAGHTRAKDTATPWAKAISYATNWLTGGTDYKPGLVSPTPDQIDYLIGQVTGGVGREAAKLAQVGESSLTGEELPLYKIPLLGRFVGTTAGQAAESARFYGNIKEIGQHDAELSGLRADRRQAEAAEYLRDNPQARMVKTADRTYREVRKLIKAKRDAVAAGASKDRIKLLDQQITARMRAFNLRIAATEERETALQ